GLSAYDDYTVSRTCISLFVRQFCRRGFPRCDSSVACLGLNTTCVPALSNTSYRGAQMLGKCVPAVDPYSRGTASFCERKLLFVSRPMVRLLTVSGYSPSRQMAYLRRSSACP